MTIVFDTNVLLDTILNRPERATACALMAAVFRKEIIGIVTANSITDLYYLSRKGIGDRKAREAIAYILSFFNIAVVDGSTCAEALSLPMEDYEDAVLAVCAERAGADCIATRDQGFLAARTPVPARLPDDLLGHLE